MYKDKFGAEINKGGSIELLDKARAYFREERDIEIVRYRTCTDVQSRPKEYLNDDDLKECCITGRKLYEIDDTISYDSAKDVRIKQKWHLIFISKSGDKYYTSYQFNQCMKNVGFEYQPTYDDIKEFNPPMLDSLMRPYYKVSDFNESFIESVTQEYQNKIVPILKKWVHKNIGKRNVIEFINDWKEIENFCNVWFKERVGNIDGIKNNIMNIIGVQYG